MTGTQIRDDVRVGIPEDTADYYTEVALLRYINNAILAIFSLLPNDALIASGGAGSLGKSTALAFAAAATSATLPADFVRFVSAHMTYSNVEGSPRCRLYSQEMIPSVATSLGVLKRSGIGFDSPICWLVGTTIQARPAPAAGDTGSLEIHYISLPTAMTALADTVPLPVELHILIAPHCIAQAKARERDYDEADRMFAAWYRFTDRYIPRIVGRHGAEYAGESAVLPIGGRQ